jgi:hypothetical protein
MCFGGGRVDAAAFTSFVISLTLYFKMILGEDNHG